MPALVIAGLLLLLDGERAASPPLVQAATRGASSAGPVAPRRAAPDDVQIETLSSREPWFGPDHQPAADLFRRAPWPAGAPGAAQQARDTALTAEAPPPAPPPHQVAGKQFDGKQWEVFLMHEDRILVVRDGQSIDSAWRVMRIAPPTMTLVNDPTGRQHVLSIGEPL